MISGDEALHFSCPNPFLTVKKFLHPLCQSPFLVCSGVALRTDLRNPETQANAWAISYPSYLLLLEDLGPILTCMCESFWGQTFQCKTHSCAPQETYPSPCALTSNCCSCFPCVYPKLVLNTDKQSCLSLQCIKMYIHISLEEIRGKKAMTENVT